MPGIDGIELQHRLKGLSIKLRVILMTGDADVPMAIQAMKAGAVDFVEKPFDEQVLLCAIEGTFSTAAHTEPENAKISKVNDKLQSLSTREKQVLEGLLAGYPNKTIAYDLNLSTRTIEVPRANLMLKMGAENLRDLIKMTIAANMSSAK